MKAASEARGHLIKKNPILILSKKVLNSFVVAPTVPELRGGLESKLCPSLASEDGLGSIEVISKSVLV